MQRAQRKWSWQPQRVCGHCGVRFRGQVAADAHRMRVDLKVGLAAVGATGLEPQRIRGHCSVHFRGQFADDTPRSAF